MNTINEAKNEALEKIVRIQTAIKVLDLLPRQEFDFPVLISITASGSYATIGIRIPYSLVALRSYRKAMGKGWKMSKKWCETQFEDSVSYHTSFTRPEMDVDGSRIKNPVQVMISLDTEIEKSLCHIEKAGEEIVTVWKVVCE